MADQDVQNTKILQKFKAVMKQRDLQKHVESIHGENNYTQKDKDEKVIHRSTFNYNQYEFHSNTRMFDHLEYCENFMDNQEIDRDKIRKQMTELVYIQVLENLNNEFPNLPGTFFENKIRWCNMLLRTKQTQEVFAQFSRQISNLLFKEFKHNRTQLGVFLTHPRPVSSSKGKGFKNIPNMIKLGVADLNASTPLSDYNLSKNRTLKIGRPLDKLLPNMQNLVNIRQNDRANSSMLRDNENNDHSASTLMVTSPRKTNSKMRKVDPSKNLAALKLQQDLEEVNHMKQEYKKIREKVTEIEGLVDRFEDNNENMERDIAEFEKTIETLEQEKETNHPTEKIRELLDRWSAEQIMTGDDMSRFATELWMTAADFEKDLNESIKGHEMLLAMKSHFYQNQIDFVKDKTCFQVKDFDCGSLTIDQMDLQDAMAVELKLKMNKKVEHSMMAQADIESRLLTYTRTDDEISQVFVVLRKSLIPASNLINNERKVKTMGEAQQYIQELRSTLSVLYIEVKNQKLEMNANIIKIETLEEEKSDLELQVSTWQSMYKFFQTMALRFARDMKWVDDKEQLKFLEENKNDYEKQEEIVRLAQNLQFGRKMEMVPLVYTNNEDSIKKLVVDLTRLGILPQARLKETKNASSMIVHLADSDRNSIFDIIEKASSAMPELQEIQENQQILNIKAQAASEAKKKAAVEKKLSISEKAQARPSIVAKKPGGALLKLASIASVVGKAQVASKNAAGSKRATISGPNKGGVKIHNVILNSKNEIIQEDMGEYIEQKYRQEMNDIEDLKKRIKLTPQQIHELQHLIQKCLHIELNSEQSIQLFDSNVESFITTLNSLIKEQNTHIMDSAEQSKHSRDNESSQAESKQPSMKDLARRDLPLGDCISMEYSTNGELVSFGIRAKLASFIFAKDESDLKNLKEIIKIVMYMNRLLSEGDNLILGRRKVNVFDPSKNKMPLGMRINSSEDSLDQIEDEDRDLDYVCRQLDQGSQTKIQNELIEVIRQHVVDLQVRTTPILRNQYASKHGNKPIEELCHMQLPGIKQNGGVVRVVDYFRTVLSYLKNYVLELPQFNRKDIDIDKLMKDFMGNRKDEKQSVPKNAHSQDGPRRMFKRQSELEAEQTKLEEDDRFDDYLGLLLKEEMTNTMKAIDDFVDKAKKRLKTVNIGDDQDLFPNEFNEKLYSTMDSVSRPNTKGFPQHKPSIAKKFSNSSFHQNFCSFRAKLVERFTHLQETVKPQSTRNLPLVGHDRQTSYTSGVQPPPYYDRSEARTVSFGVMGRNRTNFFGQENNSNGMTPETTLDIDNQRSMIRTGQQRRNLMTQQMHQRAQTIHPETARSNFNNFHSGFLSNRKPPNIESGESSNDHHSHMVYFPQQMTSKYFNEGGSFQNYGGVNPPAGDDPLNLLEDTSFIPGNLLQGALKNRHLSKQHDQDRKIAAFETKKSIATSRTGMNFSTSSGMPTTPGKYSVRNKFADSLLPPSDLHKKHGSLIERHAVTEEKSRDSHFNVKESMKNELDQVMANIKEDELFPEDEDELAINKA